MTGPFTPIGERPRWEYVHDLLTQLNIGDTITYQQIADTLNIDPDNFKRNRNPFYKAAQVWGTEHKRALRPVPNIGYRVVDAAEHETIAKGHHRKSKRALRRGRTALANADRSRLTDEQRQRFDRMESTIARHEDMIRRIDVRTMKVEKAVEIAKKQHDVTHARIAALEDALRRHGIDPGATDA